MAYTTINKSTDYFNNKLYTGTGTSGSPFSLTGVGFAPDWVWIKRRDGAAIGHRLFDRVRGATKYIDSSGGSAETTNTSTLTAFGSDGFTLQNEGSVNDGSALFASFNWKANGQGSSNTNGSINTTYTSASATSGFSIVQYTGTGSNATVGHGLSTAPNLVIIKRTNGTQSIRVGTGLIGWDNVLYLDTTNASGSGATSFNSTATTNQVFSVGSDTGTNGSGDPHIAYCFSDVVGYQKIGKFIGTGDANGAFVYTGFKPDWIMIKKTNETNDWKIFNSAAYPANLNGAARPLVANTTAAEDTGNFYFDILSNGFKPRTGNGAVNSTDDAYLYIAVGQSLVGSNNVPCTAR